MIVKPDFDKRIMETNRSKWFSYTLGVFFAGACCFAPNLIYGLLLGLVSFIWIFIGNDADVRLMVWEIKKEMNK